MIERLRAALAGLPVTEQKMFGGTCFMLSGNMLVGTSKRGLLVRVGKEAHAAAVARPHARPMEMGGRAMEGYVFVDEAGTETAKDLNGWLKRRPRLRRDAPAQARQARPRSRPQDRSERRRRRKGGRK